MYQMKRFIDMDKVTFVYVFAFINLVCVQTGIQLMTSDNPLISYRRFRMESSQWYDKFRKSQVLLNNLVATVTPDILGNQKYFFCSIDLYEEKQKSED